MAGGRYIQEKYVLDERVETAAAVHGISFIYIVWNNTPTNISLPLLAAFIKSIKLLESQHNTISFWFFLESNLC